MSVNLASKYESQILTKYMKESFLAGLVSSKYEFNGVKSISIYTPVTVDLSTYSRTGTNRFGTPVEMQDTLQVLTLTQEPSFAITIDKGNNADQLNIKGAGEMLNLQIKEKMVPFQDKYGLKVFCQQAGTSAVISAPTTSTMIGLLATGVTALDNAMAPEENRIIVVGATNFNKIRTSTEVLAIDPMAKEALTRGVVGMFMECKIVKVPDSYMPTGVQFLIFHKDSVIMPMKLKTYRILTDVAGLDGALLEGRNYFDAFVLGQKADGIYVGILTANKVATPVITPTGASHAVGAVSNVAFYYTTDGSDPRYSSTAVVYSSAVTLTSGHTIKVVGKYTATDVYKAWSDVASATYTA